MPYLEMLLTFFRPSLKIRLYDTSTKSGNKYLQKDIRLNLQVLYKKKNRMNNCKKFYGISIIFPPSPSFEFQYLLVIDNSGLIKEDWLLFKLNRNIATKVRKEEKRRYKFLLRIYISAKKIEWCGGWTEKRMDKKDNIKRSRDTQ